MLNPDGVIVGNNFAQMCLGMIFAIYLYLINILRKLSLFTCSKRS